MRRSAVHKDLRTPKYRMRVVRSKKTYTRKTKNLKEILHHDYIDADPRRLYF